MVAAPHWSFMDSFWPSTPISNRIFFRGLQNNTKEIPCEVTIQYNSSKLPTQQRVHDMNDIYLSFSCSLSLSFSCLFFISILSLSSIRSSIVLFLSFFDFWFLFLPMFFFYYSYKIYCIIIYIYIYRYLFSSIVVSISSLLLLPGSSSSTRSSWSARTRTSGATSASSQHPGTKEGESITMENL